MGEQGTAYRLCAGGDIAADAGLASMRHESGRSVRGRPHIDHDGNGRLSTAR